MRQHRSVLHGIFPIKNYILVYPSGRNSANFSSLDKRQSHTNLSRSSLKDVSFLGKNIDHSILGKDYMQEWLKENDEVIRARKYLKFTYEK